MTADCGADLVADALVDGERLQVEAFGGVEVRSTLGQRAELVIAGRHAGPIIEPRRDLEYLGITLLRGLIVAAQLSEDAELVIRAREAGLIAQPFLDLGDRVYRCSAVS